MASTSTHNLHITAPRGAEDLLASELEQLGLTEVKARTGGVSAQGNLEQAYRVCLWSRIASRVLLALGELEAHDKDALYVSAGRIDWTEHIAQGSSLAISASGVPVRGSSIDNTHFAALKVKDAIVDQLRERWGRRPNIDPQQPDLRLRLHLQGDKAHLSVDLSGEGLHRRGYRVAKVAAPLRENLAAAVLMRAGWPALVDEQLAAGRRAYLVDPMCGSATLAIEAAWMAGDVAPSLERESWGFKGWVGHDPTIWAELLTEARERREAGFDRLDAVRVIGYDSEPGAVAAGLSCTRAAGLEGVVHIEKRSLSAVEPPSGSVSKVPSESSENSENTANTEAPTVPSIAGLVVCNPPWGERLGERRELESLYAAIGAQLRQGFVGWEVAILTGDPGLGRHLGLHARRRNPLQDGPIECQILRISLDAESLARVEARAQAKAQKKSEGRAPRERSEGGVSFANRLKKNAKQLRSWLRKSPEVSCYRVYDQDIPEYAFAVDLYREVSPRHGGDAGPLHAHVQEYVAPATIEPHLVRSRRGEALAVIREDLDLPRERVHLKRRERQKGKAQYERLGEEGREFCVAEGPARLWVNLDDYLDSGLFLDHRPLRLELSDPLGPAAGKRVLNLFCYTASLSVHAALGGAKHTTSVDMSRNYLEWARRNLALNGFTAHGPEEPEPAGDFRGQPRQGQGPGRGYGQSQGYGQGQGQGGGGRDRGRGGDDRHRDRNDSRGGGRDRDAGRGRGDERGRGDDRGRRSSRRGPHQLVRADILDWLRRQGALRWDLIICDPPSFSNSKRMEGSFDVERDHVDLIDRCVALLSPGGKLLFSTNKRRFKLDHEGLEGLQVTPHAHSVPEDFGRRSQIHQAWWIER